MHELSLQTNSSLAHLNCTNLVTCNNGEDCAQVSLCRLNDTCSLVQKCHEGSCEEKEMCHEESQSKVQEEPVKATNETYMPVKTKVERETAKAQVK